MSNHRVGMPAPVMAALSVVVATAISATSPAAGADKKPAEPAAAQPSASRIPVPQTTGSIAPEKRRQQVGHGEQVDVKGFRSATFGMDESRVRASIRQDFKVADKDIKTTDNKSERTKVLSVSVDNVLPGGGRAEVSYVMGYQSKKLIQVGVSWSAASDAKLTADQLLANANLLRSHFMSAGYRPDTLALNLPVSSGLMMFRGSDADGHTTLLMLHGRTVKSAEKQRVLAPTALTLYYVVDPVKPDVYRLPKGLF